MLVIVELGHQMYHYPTATPAASYREIAYTYSPGVGAGWGKDDSTEYIFAGLMDPFHSESIKISMGWSNMELQSQKPCIATIQVGISPKALVNPGMERNG